MLLLVFLTCKFVYHEMQMYIYEACMCLCVCVYTHIYAHIQKYMYLYFCYFIYNKTILSIHIHINPKYMGPINVLHTPPKYIFFLLNKTASLDHLIFYLMRERIKFGLQPLQLWSLCYMLFYLIEQVIENTKIVM